METQALQYAENPTMKFFYIFTMAICFVFNTYLLEVNWDKVAIALGGAFSGSIISATIQRENSKIEQLYKILGSSISGIIIGAIFAKWRGIVEVEYLIGTYYFSGMLSLFFVRSIIKITSQNSDSVTITIFQTFIRRVFNVRPKTAKRTRRVTSVLHLNDKEEKENEL